MNNHPPIVPCIWYNMNAAEAIDFYSSIFKNCKILHTLKNTERSNPSDPDSVLAIDFELEGLPFLALNGGSQYKPNPSISFFVNSTDRMEIKKLWDKFSIEGNIKMSLDKYDYSEYYGWIEDKYGISWQLMLVEEEPVQKIVPSFFFTGKEYGKAEEAVNFYTSIFPDSSIGLTAKYPAGSEPEKEGAIMYEAFELCRQKFVAMESAQEHGFEFNEGISLIVYCKSQDQIDDYWNKLTTGGNEIQCGWLKDKYGVAWQITPENLPKLLRHNNKDKADRVMEAMMRMVKLNMAELEEA